MPANHPLNLIIMGPPGSGKGTQGVVLSRLYGIPHISTGEIIRNNIKRGTPLGLEMKDRIAAGEYAPDSVVNGMIRERLGEPDADMGFILDGYPRTLQQVGELASMLHNLDRELSNVLFLDVPSAETVQRLVKRAKEENRPEDTAEVVLHRIDVYNELTLPLVEAYEEKGVLRRIDGVGKVPSVTERILAVLR